MRDRDDVEAAVPTARMYRCPPEEGKPKPINLTFSIPVSMSSIFIRLSRVWCLCVRASVRPSLVQLMRAPRVVQQLCGQVPAERPGVPAVVAAPHDHMHND